MADSTNLVLITGGNSGIGFTLASLLLQDSTKHVLLACRNREKGQTAIQELLKAGPKGKVDFLELDVSSEASITVAADFVKQQYGRLDTLINNAALGGSTSGTLGQRLSWSFSTNTTGPLLTVEAFASLLRLSTSPRIVNVSSGAGVIRYMFTNTFPLFPDPDYYTSKAALNMATAWQIRKFAVSDPAFKIFAYSPGFVVSNLGPLNNTDNGAEPTLVGAAPLVRVVDGKRDADVGKFLHRDEVVEW